MHIEPGLVSEAKIVLSYGTAAASLVLAAKLATDDARIRGALSVMGRTAVATAAVFTFFQILPHHPVGVSEVHLILGSTLFLLLGVAPSAFGLVLGLFMQGLLFAPQDLPQFGMNVTTLLVPLFGLQLLARKVIAPATPYVDLQYREALALSLAYQGGIVAWVAFWAVYGQGFTATNLAAVGSFGAAYMLVVLIEPLADLAVLALSKTVRRTQGSTLLNARLFSAA